jgi:hypothetical protein
MDSFHVASAFFGIPHDCEFARSFVSAFFCFGFWISIITDTDTDDKHWKDHGNWKEQ